MGFRFGEKESTRRDDGEEKRTLCVTLVKVWRERTVVEQFASTNNVGSVSSYSLPALNNGETGKA